MWLKLTICTYTSQNNLRLVIIQSSISRPMRFLICIKYFILVQVKRRHLLSHWVLYCRLWVLQSREWSFKHYPQLKKNTTKNSRYPQVMIIVVLCRALNSTSQLKTSAQTIGLFQSYIWWGGNVETLPISIRMTAKSSRRSAMDRSKPEAVKRELGHHSRSQYDFEASLWINLS